MQFLCKYFQIFHKLTHCKVAFSLSFLFLLPLGCSHFSSDLGNQEQSVYEGMLYVEASATQIPLGTTDSKAPTEIQTSAQASFDYNFYLGATEVSKGEYSELMGYSPSEAADSLPAVMLTFYDAVLFCNARSREEGLDTVYSYIARNSIDGQHSSTFSLEGLKFHPDRFGYRLPTEAEWVFAYLQAHGTPKWNSPKESIQKQAVYIGNADSGPVSVQSGIQENGFYNLPGNVMEWIQDWKSDLPQNDVQNYAGTTLPESGAERLIKGGSFSHDLKKLNPWSRSDVYPVISSSKTNYIGFRVALGVISGPEYSESSMQTSGSAELLASKSELTGFVSAAEAAICFVDQSTGFLNFVDFRDSPYLVKAFEDSLRVEHPVLSPDARFVAFSTSAEGQLKPSQIYIRSLQSTTASDTAVLIGDGAIPRWWVDPVSADTFLVYASSARGNGDADWLTEKTYRLQFSEGAAAGTPEVLWDKGAYHSGISPDGRTMLTASPDLRIVNLDSDESQHLFLNGSQNGKGEDGSEQVCNASLAPDSSKRMAFIDFGYPGTSSLTGESYSVHEYLFLADSNGKTLNTFQVPDGYSTWTHPEWSSRGDFVISTLGDELEQNSMISLLRLEDGEVLPLLRGVELKHPYLWVGEKQNVMQNDSMGAYNFPAQGAEQEMFDAKLRTFWKNHEALEIAIIGSSRSDYGIDPKLFQDYALNLSVSGADLNTPFQMLKNYILPHSDRLHTVIFSLDLDALVHTNWLWEPKLSHTAGVHFDLQNAFWEQGLPESFYTAVNSQPSTHAYETALKNQGSLKVDPEGWGELLLRSNNFTNGTDYARGIEILDSIVILCEQRGIKAIGVIFPQHPEFSTHELWGTHGPTNELASEMMEQVQALEQQSEFFEIFDEYKGGSHDYEDQHAHDVDHLSWIGAELLTQRLIERYFAN